MRFFFHRRIGFEHISVRLVFRLNFIDKSPRYIFTHESTVECCFSCECFNFAHNLERRITNDRPTINANLFSGTAQLLSAVAAVDCEPKVFFSLSVCQNVPTVALKYKTHKQTAMITHTKIQTAMIAWRKRLPRNRTVNNWPFRDRRESTLTQAHRLLKHSETAVEKICVSYTWAWKRFGLPTGENTLI